MSLVLRLASLPTTDGTTAHQNAEEKRAEERRLEGLYEKGRWRDIATHYREVVRREPRNAKAQYLLAEAIFMLSPPAHERSPPRPVNAAELAEAIIHLRAAVALQPNNVDWHSDLGNYLQIAGRNREAVAEFRRALQLVPPIKPFELRKMEVVTNATRNEMRGKRVPHNDSASVFWQGVQTFNNNWELGLSLTKLGEYQEAIQHFEVAMAFDPREPFVLLPFGDALEHTGQHRKAVAAWNAVIQTSWPDTRLRYEAEERLKRN